MDKCTLGVPQVLEFRNYCRELAMWIEKHPTATLKELDEHLTELNKRNVDLIHSLKDLKHYREVLAKQIKLITERKVSHVSFVLEYQVRGE